MICCPPYFSNLDLHGDASFESHFIVVILNDHPVQVADDQVVVEALHPPVLVQHALRHRVPRASEEVIVVTTGSGLFCILVLCLPAHPLRQAVLDHLVHQLQQKPDLYLAVRLLRPLGVECVFASPDLDDLASQESRLIHLAGDDLRAANYTGSLVSLLQEGEAFVKRNSHKGWFKEPDRRVELPDYPERSVTEGIVNALIHRDYLIVGSEVHIDMFDDRLEIFSPGGMYDGINVQDRDIMRVPSERRNPNLTDVFTRLIYMERRGSGFKKIIEDYQFQRNYTGELAPEFLSEHGAFFLTLKNLNYYQGSNKGTNQGTNQGSKVDWEERKELVINLIRKDSTIKTTDIQKHLALTERQLSRTLKMLKDDGRLDREGSSRSGRWIVHD